MRSSGKVSVAALLGIAAVLYVVYAIIAVVPVFLDNHWDVNEALEAGIAQAERGDAQVRSVIKERLNSREIGTGPDGLGITDEQITIVRNPVARIITVRLDYEREVPLTPFGPRVPIHFSPRKRGDLAR